MNSDHATSYVRSNAPLASASSIGTRRKSYTVTRIAAAAAMLWSIPCVLSFSGLSPLINSGRIPSPDTERRIDECPQILNMNAIQKQKWNKSLCENSRSRCHYHMRHPFQHGTTVLFMSSRNKSGDSLSPLSQRSFLSSDSSWSRSATVDDTETATSTDEDIDVFSIRDSNGASSAGTGRSGSRFGVRSRVRSVLKKARNRTGIANSSEKTKRKNRNSEISPQSVIAEAASIGGLGAVVIDDEGTVDVALDYYGGMNSTNGGSSSPSSVKSAPASTYSPPPVQITKGPEDMLRPSTKPTRNGTTKDINGNISSPPLSVKDAFTGDVSAAFSVPPSPLPFTLPKLTDTQRTQLESGERVQFQSDMGREGSGFVVVDVNAPADVVWDCLLDFESYPETIPTVRDVRMATSYSSRQYGKASETRASFTLSKFRLRIAAIHKYRPHPQGDYLVFTLDPTSTNLVLQNAKGVWYTQADVDGQKGKTRVWLLCELKVSSMLPKFIVDYASKKAMPRATSWLKPQVEAASALWLRKPNGTNEKTK